MYPPENQQMMPTKQVPQLPTVVHNDDDHLDAALFDFAIWSFRFI
jgi:hypothetical protein